MPKLNDTQLILLAHAAKRDSGSFYPLPETLTGAARATKAISSLIKAGMAEERETKDREGTCRTEGDIGFGVFITPAGAAAIGVTDAGQGDTGAPAAAPAPEPVPRTSKAAAVLALLQRNTGATMPELIEATGWLPHTTRAALTGLRKKGHAIQRGKRGDVTCYTLAAAVAA